jgi:hypothetical protein
MTDGDKLRQFAKDFLRVYIVEIDSEGSPKSTLSEVMAFVEQANRYANDIRFPNMKSEGCEHDISSEKKLRCVCCDECGEILDVLD